MAKMNNIINEEIKKFLNESHIIGGDNFKFKQQVNKSTFYNYDLFTTEYDTDISQSNMVVYWGISFWVNDWGIENFIIDIEKIEGQFMLQLYDKQSDELVQETPKNINDYQWKFIIDESNAQLIKGGTLYIKDLDFNFKEKTCTVGF
jgi:hypothetical protein